MMSNPILEVRNYGQSIWYDNIHRGMLLSGEMQQLIAEGVAGVTSNPTIFEKAIAGSQDYDADLQALVKQGLDSTGSYEALALEDIRQTADLLRPVHEKTDGQDGYVSLEVRPDLAYDTPGTISEARRLFAAVERPNVMIKVPATTAGVPAIEALIAVGVNINVTLIFSILHYEAVARAYLSGLEQRLAVGLPLHTVASVASFFVSRVDTAVDRELERLGVDELRGKIAVANAKVAYTRFCSIFSGERWEALARNGARPQRPLWASTGTKNPAYSDTLYVDNLIGPHTVNTVPPATLQAFRQHGRLAPTLEAGLPEAYDNLRRLAELGVDLHSITQKLQEDGVDAFASSYDALIASLEGKIQQLR